ncbi:unnamed protein product, partial [Prorocentrum cordatum]
VDGYLKQPLPEGWTAHQTDEGNQYGKGYTYYVHASSGQSRWTRPDEEEFLRRLSRRTARPPIPGSRLFFAAVKERKHNARWADLEDKASHLAAARPMLRALPAGVTEPPPQQAGDQVVSVALRDQFPVLHSGCTEA